MSRLYSLRREMTGAVWKYALGHKVLAAYGDLWNKLENICEWRIGLLTNRANLGWIFLNGPHKNIFGFKEGCNYENPFSIFDFRVKSWGATLKGYELQLVWKCEKRAWHTTFILILAFRDWLRTKSCLQPTGAFDTLLRSCLSFVFSDGARCWATGLSFMLWMK